MHERPAPYGPRLNLVVVLKDTGSIARGAPTCTLHLLRGGRYLRRLGGLAFESSAPEGPWKEARFLIARLYFPPSKVGGPSAGGAEPNPVGSREEGADIDWQVVASFLRKYRDQVNVLDVDECASPDAAERRLRVLVRAAAAGSGRTVAR